MSKHLDGQKNNAPKCSGLVVKYMNETKISDLLEMTKLLDGEYRELNSKMPSMR